jgi:hypothetical protein
MAQAQGSRWPRRPAASSRWAWLTGNPTRSAATFFALATAGLLSPGIGAAQVIRGTVFEEGTDAPVANVEVLVRDTAGGTVGTTQSDADGRFRIELEQMGDFTVVFRHLTYAEVTSRRITVRPGEEVALQARLSVEAVELDPVSVVARRFPDDPRLRDFYERAEHFRDTGRGRIIMRDDLETTRPVHTSNIINTLPPRMRCSTIFVDGLLVDDARFIDSVVRPDEIEGMEIYHDRVHIPLQFQNRATECAILIWRRPYAEGGRPLSFWRLAGAAVGFAALVLILR